MSKINHSAQTKFLALLTLMGELYKHSVNESFVALYWQDLGHYSPQALEVAFTRHRQCHDQGRFFPKPADLLRWLEPNAEHQALTAWGQVLDALKRIGPYASVQFEDGCIAPALAEIGGWRALGHLDEKSLGVVGKRFLRAYSVAWENQPSSSTSALPHCAGWVEGHNQAPQPPVRIPRVSVQPALALSSGNSGLPAQPSRNGTGLAHRVLEKNTLQKNKLSLPEKNQHARTAVPSAKAIDSQFTLEENAHA